MYKEFPDELIFIIKGEIQFIEPLSYFKVLFLSGNAVIISDLGGTY